MGDAGPLAVKVPGLALTVYAVTGLPPLSAGAAKLTLTCPLPGTAATEVGAPGMVAGVTGPLAALAGPRPSALTALTVNE